MRVIAVDDPTDERLVELTALTDADARRRVEAEHGCFVAEGRLVLETVVETGHRLRSVLVSEPRLPRVAELLADVEVDVYVGPQHLLEAVTGFPIHRGIVASVARPARPALATVAGEGPVVLVEGVNDHENIGALFRNAAAFGARIVLDDGCADPLYRRAVRVSLGHVLRVPWTVAPLGEAVRVAAASGLRVLALSPAGTRDVAEVTTAAERSAWMIGAEGPGLSAAALAAADDVVRIPMATGIDSLNVATAAAVALAFSRRPG